MSKTEENILQAYQKYAPKNMPYEKFKEMIEKDPKILDGMGEFSTFDLGLAKTYKARKAKSGISDDKFRTMLKDSIDQDAMENLAKKHAKIYEDIICSDDDILLGAWTFDILNKKQRQDLATKIINGINKHFEIEKKLDVRYIEKKYQQPIKYLLIEITAKFLVKVANIIANKGYALVDWGGYYDNKSTIVLHNQEFFSFMGTLSHEYGHFIDRNFPDLGMLGSQIAFYGDKVYSSVTGDEIYKSNPTEASSFRIEEIVKEHIEKVLEEQIHKKPNLYAKSLQARISYAEIKIAALRLKYSKIFAEVEKANKSYQNLKNKKLNEQYPNAKDLSPIQFANAVSKINQEPDVKKLREKYHKAQDKIPREYNELQSDLDHWKYVLKEFNFDQTYFLANLRDFLCGNIK